ncbi:MAG TPA: hydrogenase maturation protease [Bryobacteraceae bacterium]|nr:hydrogenase maturation protease [Bryobacteraceae bacterium]
MGRMLIAGIGNIFLGDDGFGVEVARALSSRHLPGFVRAADFGIRGLHLAYELLDGGYSTVILVDAAPRGGPPGSIYLIEPDSNAPGDAASADAHSMTPESVLALLKMLGGTPGRVLIVGCEPVSVEEGIGLSGPVSLAVEEAVRLLFELIERAAVEHEFVKGH